MEDLKFDLQLFAEGDEPTADNTAMEQPNVDSNANPGEPTGDETPDYTLDENGNVTFADDVFNDMIDYSDDESDGDGSGDVQPQPTPEDNQNPPQPQMYTVKVDGQEQQVTLDELRNGYMRQADYTRKTQELANQRKQFEATQAPQPQPQNQPQQQVSPSQYYQELTNYAKQRVEQNLGKEFDEYDPVCQTALADEVSTIKAAMYERNLAQKEFKQVFDKYSRDPNFRSIDAYAAQRLQTLPYKQAVQVQKAFNSYDSRAIDRYMAACRDEFYRSQGMVPANQAQQPRPSRIVPNQQKPKPPYVESTGVARETKNVKPSVNYQKLGGLTLEDQAKIAAKLGLG